MYIKKSTSSKKFDSSKGVNICVDCLNTLVFQNRECQDQLWVELIPKLAELRDRLAATIPVKLHIVSSEPKIFEYVRGGIKLSPEIEYLDKMSIGELANVIAIDDDPRSVPRAKRIIIIEHDGIPGETEAEQVCSMAEEIIREAFTSKQPQVSPPSPPR